MSNPPARATDFKFSCLCKQICQPESPWCRLVRNVVIGDSTDDMAVTTDRTRWGSIFFFFIIIFADMDADAVGR